MGGKDKAGMNINNAVRLGLMLGSLVGVFAGAISAQAYEEITIADGGSLSGTVTLVGDVPKPKGYNLTTLPDQIYCGRISDGHGWRRDCRRSICRQRWSRVRKSDYAVKALRVATCF